MEISNGAGVRWARVNGGWVLGGSSWDEEIWSDEGHGGSSGRTAEELQ